MAGAERQSRAERAVELSKRIDKYFIVAGTGIYILVSSAVGAAIVLGSVLTMIPADMMDKWLKKRKARKQ